MHPAIARLLPALFLAGALLPGGAGAADFLFTWKARPEPGLTAYGIYQRTGDSPYVRIRELPVTELDDPQNPSCLVTGLTPGATYRFAATALFGADEESDFFGRTCITVNDRIVECLDDDDSGAAILVSCFITTAAAPGRRPPP